MEDDLVQDVNYLYKRGRWSEVLELGVAPGACRSLLWAWPSESTLSFVADIVRRQKKVGVVSVGCGSGLLEWLLQQATGVPVVGVELEDSWWNSKHSTNKYIEHKFVRMPVDRCVVPADHALLFCYFNSSEAFQEYVRAYGGDLVFIVGPGPNQARYTDPLPLRPDFGDQDWTLLAQHDIQDSGDIVAAWSR